MPAYQIVTAIVLAAAILAVAIGCWWAAYVRDEPRTRSTADEQAAR